MSTRIEWAHASELQAIFFDVGDDGPDREPVTAPTLAISIENCTLAISGSVAEIRRALGYALRRLPQ